jgi:hypothetical protein
MLFSLAYLFLAIQQKGQVTGWTMPSSVPLVVSFTPKQNV